jgi:hypothetical protein
MNHYLLPPTTYTLAAAKNHYLMTPRALLSRWCYQYLLAPCERLPRLTINLFWHHVHCYRGYEPLYLLAPSARLPWLRITIWWPHVHCYRGYESLFARTSCTVAAVMNQYLLAPCAWLPRLRILVQSVSSGSASNRVSSFVSRLLILTYWQVGKH